MKDKLAAYEVMLTSRAALKIEYFRSINKVCLQFNQSLDKIKTIADRDKVPTPKFNHNFTAYKEKYVTYVNEENDLFIRWRNDDNKEQIFLSFRGEIIKNIV